MRKTLIEQLAAARDRSGRTQAEIAAAIDVERAHISNIERGFSDTKLSKAEIWADLCGYEIMLVPKGGDIAALQAELQALQDRYDALRQHIQAVLDSDLPDKSG